MTQVTLKRLAAQPGLALANLLGLTVAAALLMSVPLYATAVYANLLAEEVARTEARTNRPPFTYQFGHNGQINGPLTWAEAAPAHNFLSGGEPDLGLDPLYQTSYLATDEFRVFPEGGGSSLDRMQIGTLAGIEAHIEFESGGPPQPASGQTDVIPVMIYEAWAAETDVRPGDRLLLDNLQAEAGDGQTGSLLVEVSGIWRARDLSEDFWYNLPHAYEHVLLLPFQTFEEVIVPGLNEPVHEAAWYLVLDGEGVTPGNASQLVTRAASVENRAVSLLPEINIRVSPAEPLGPFFAAVESLTTSLAALNVPVLVLVLTFIVLVVTLAVDSRRNEIAVMRSRGASILQVLGISLLEGAILGVVALGLGALLSLYFARLMGQTRSFLDFSAASDLNIVISGPVLQNGLLAIGLALLARLPPTLAAARHTVVTYKQERARAFVQPWWQRAWLDVLLMLPAIYGYYALSQPNAVIEGETGAATLVVAQSPFTDPLLLLAPALAVLAGTLVCLRLLPWLMQALSWLMAQTPRVSALMALRQLARTPNQYHAPLLLLILTASLSIFTASLARTLDLQLFDEVYYQIGADVALRETGGSQDPGNYFFLPASAYESLPEVAAAAQVGRFPAQTRVGQRIFTTSFLGVDSAAFRQVSFWREDFASYHMGYLLNSLASLPNGILLPSAFLAESGLRVGDPLVYTVQVLAGGVEIRSQIVGSFDYFPTWYPEESALIIVGNLQDLFAQVGGDLPHQVWLRLAPGADLDRFEANLQRELRISREWMEPFTPISQAQTRPERQGMFGLLSVGFVAAALLTVLGFFLYALFSFRRRFIEMGILRAIGLSSGQMIRMLGWELAMMILTGLGVGTLLGVGVSRAFIPFWNPGTGGSAVPPYLVEINWAATAQIYILFGILFISALLALGGLLLRMRMFQAVKLGETA